MTKHISHTCGKSCRPARYWSSSTHSHTSKRCLATALRGSYSITTGHYVRNKDMDPKRLGSENIAIKEAQAHTYWHRWYIVVCSTCSSKLYNYFSWNAYILRLSEIRPIPWFLTEEVEVLVNPSIWLNLNKVEPGTNDREYLSSLIGLRIYVRILVFVRHLVCKGHFRISNVPPYSTLSLGWMQEYPDDTFA